MPYPVEAILYQCNRGIIYNCGNKNMIEFDQEIVARKRSYRKAKYCDCEFKVKIVKPIYKKNHVEVRLIIVNGYKEFHWFFCRDRILLKTSISLN